MHLAFVDDSQQDDPPRLGLGPLLAVGAVIVPDTAVGRFAEGFAQTRSTLGIPPDEEVKWSPPRGSFLRGRADGPLVSALREQMLDLAAECCIRTAVVIVDHGRVWRNRSKAEVGQEILKWLYERISMCLGDLDDTGIVIADKPGGGSAEEARWLNETLRLTNDGTEYVEPGRVVLPVVTAPSHHVPHLQLADLVVSASCAAVAGRPNALALAPRLLHLAHKHSLRYAGGAGIVLFPPELINLHYWAFGETTWARTSPLSGWGLPKLNAEW